MNRRGMDGWMGKGREREMYFIVVFSNSLAGEKEKVGARRVCVLEERKEREEKREKERREKKGNQESARLVWMRTAKRARFGVVIYTERDWTRGFSAFVFFVLFSLLSVFFFSRECFFVSYSFYRRTHRRRQRRCYDYFESSIITFPSWPRTNITTTGIFRYLQTNIR